MYPRIAARLYGAPLLIHPEKAEIIAWALRDKLTPDIEIAEPNGPDASRFMGSRRRTNGYALTRATKGVALIPILGSLVNRGAWLDSPSGLTSYEGLDAQFKDAASDNEVHSIVIDMDTPGGEAGGMFKLVSTIRQVGRSKRIVAVVDDMAASAGYGIASAAHEIVVSPTSVVGSIGVVLIHLDRSAQFADAGVKPTLIFAGRHKVDGHPFGPLPPEVVADKQRQIGMIYDQFIETIAAGRGARTTAQKARETEARVYVGNEAVKAGLADRIGSLDQVITELSSRKPGRSTPSGARAAANSEQKITAGWQKAFAKTNSRMGFPDDPAPPRASLGWAKAVANANRRFGGSDAK
jgi:signal peptide peptidase SppA